MGKIKTQNNSKNYLRFSVKILRAVGGWPHLGDFSSAKEAFYHLLTLGAIIALLIDLIVKGYALVYVFCYKWESLELFLEEVIVLITGKFFTDKF